MSGSAELHREAERLLQNMRWSTYSHRTEVDEADGIYVFDCSGFVDYCLGRVLPDSLDAVPRAARHFRALAQDYHDFFRILRHAEEGPGGWKRIQQAGQLLPGDVIAWLEQPCREDRNTGHVMVVRTPPVQDPDHPGELLVSVIDSTEFPHAHDTRPAGRSGLGWGTIGLILDQSGRPTAYRWRGGISRSPQSVSIAFGRIGVVRPVL